MVKRIRSSLVFWILLVYAGAMAGHLLWQTAFTGKATRESRGFYLQHALRVSKPLLKDRGRELQAYLGEAVELGLIDFYELELPGKPAARGGLGPEEKPVLAEPVSEVKGFVWGKADTADATLRIASGVGWRSRLSQAWAKEQARLPADCIFLLVACAVAFVFQGTMRRNAAKTASAVLRDGRKAKVLRAAAAAAATAEPRDFEGVFARTVILLEGDAASAVATVEAFCADAAALVARYQGKIHSLHGHELLTCFSEEEPSRLPLLAFAAARDLELLAGSRGLHASTCLAWGRFHEAQVLGSTALFGAAVDETAASRSARKPGVHCSDSFVKARGKREIPALSEVLERVKRGEPGSADALAYHRSDEGLVTALRALVSEENWSREAFVAVMSELRRVSCRKCSPALQEAFRALLAKELAAKDSYRLSSTLALAPHLLNRAVVDKTLEKMFLEAVALRDRRVRANAVELFTRFFPEREIPELRPLVRDEDNRVSANALIKAACERFDEKVIAKVEERVRGGSVAHVASALHAIGEIAAYYKRTDPLFLGTKIAFLRLFDSVPEWAQHPNPMIRRQALIAAHKLGAASLNARLQALFHHTRDPELLSLFEGIYGWKKASVADTAEKAA